MKQLIVNADDLGYTRGVNAGIAQAHREGIVTSATIMANGGAFEDAVLTVQQLPRLGVGVHLNVVEGRPVALPSEVPSLVDEFGSFMSKYRLVRRHALRKLQLDELRREVDAQISRVCDAGITPTHVDAHKNIHAYPAFFRVILEAVQSHGIRAVRLPLEKPRIRDLLTSPGGAVRTLLLGAASAFSRRYLRSSSVVTTDAFVGAAQTGNVTSKWLLRCFASLSHKTVELMVHPGLCDEELRRKGTRLTTQRETELLALTDPQVSRELQACGIRLLHFGQLEGSCTDRLAVAPNIIN